MNRLETIIGHLTASNLPVNASLNLVAADSLQPNDVVILATARTPIGSFNGSLLSVSAVTLGSIAIKGALEKAKISPSHVNAVYMGNVLTANEGQAPARQAALAAGIPNTVPCTTINKVCASGMKAIMLAGTEIILGHARVAVAGGMESMSNSPYLLPKARQGLRMGDSKVIDSMQKDGLIDPYSDSAMGVIAEMCAEEYEISRKDQDDYAISSYRRSAEAWKNKKFSNSIVPVEVISRGKKQIISEDEDYKKVNLESIHKLPGVFGRGNTVTAANASNISDGAAAVVLASAAFAKQHGCVPLAVIRGWADAATKPEAFTIAPSLAIPIALKRAGLSLSDIDYFEINEAFSVVVQANCKILSVPKDRVNVYGGGVSLGHPLGCSGARIVDTLLSVLIQEKGKLGCAGICNGGGGASAIVIEKL